MTNDMQIICLRSIQIHFSALIYAKRVQAKIIYSSRTEQKAWRKLPEIVAQNELSGKRDVNVNKMAKNLISLSTARWFADSAFDNDIQTLL